MKARNTPVLIYRSALSFVCYDGELLLLLKMEVETLNCNKRGYKHHIICDTRNKQLDYSSGGNSRNVDLC